MSIELKNEHSEYSSKIGMMFLSDEAFLRTKGLSFREIDALNVFIFKQMSLEEYKQRYDVTDDRVSAIYNRSIKRVFKIVQVMLEKASGQIYEKTIENLTKKLRFYENILNEIKGKLNFEVPNTLKEKLLSIKIEELDISIRLFNLLRKIGLNTANDMFERKDEMFSSNMISGRNQHEYSEIIHELETNHFLTSF